jgi:excisionase family DNA binding protein
LSALNSTPPRRADWGTLTEAARLYGVSPRTIRRMIARGEIEARRVSPRLLRVDLASVHRATTSVGGKR